MKNSMTIEADGIVTTKLGVEGQWARIEIRAMDEILVKVKAHPRLSGEDQPYDLVPLGDLVTLWEDRDCFSFEKNG